MPFVTRAEWGARKPKSAGNSISSHPKGVAVHYEGPQMGSRDHSKCDDLVRTIQAFHMDSRQWADVAYSYMVCEHGYVYEGRGVGKGSAANGTTAANLAYYAVCGLVGKGDNVPAALTDGVRDAIDICRRNGAGDEVVGHRDLFSTECPGDVLYSFVKAGAPRSSPVGGGGKSVHVPAAQPEPVKAATGTDPARVKRLQQLLELTGDGKWGDGTDEWALRLRTAARAHLGYPKNDPQPFREDLVQKVIDTTPDGAWGPQSQAALKAWVRSCQGVLGEPADGSWGPGTDKAFLALRAANRNRF